MSGRLPARLVELYHKQRETFFSESYPGLVLRYGASDCLNIARARYERERFLCGPIVCELINRDLVRVRIEPDEWGQDKGDMFDPDECPDIHPNTLKRQEREYNRKAREYGFCGFVSEFRASSFDQWVMWDSCWGFEAWEESLMDETAREFLSGVCVAWLERFDLDPETAPVVRRAKSIKEAILCA